MPFLAVFVPDGPIFVISIGGIARFAWPFLRRIEKNIVVDGFDIHACYDMRCIFFEKIFCRNEKRLYFCTRFRQNENREI